MKWPFLYIVLVAGCASVQVTPLNAPTRTLTPRAAEDVQIYMTRAPDQPYDEVYMIRSDAGDSTQALKAMRKKAGELGCDGIIITGAADRVVSTADATGNSTISMREGFLGSCVILR